MGKKYLFLDVSYLCHQAFHTVGQQLSHGEIKTGVIYGFLRSLQTMMEYHRTNRFVFCFDYGKSKRKDMYKPYKANRKKDWGEKEWDLYRELEGQIRMLRKRYLKQIGFRNVFYYKGYEADDVLAQLTRRVKNGSEYVIVSADHDLFQLIRSNVRQFNPTQKKFFTIQFLKQELGITPDMWHMVKAIAGCSSDNIEGIKGVGEKTAIKYLTGNLKETTKAYEAIESSSGEEIIRRNVKLTKLPLKGLPFFRIREDCFDTQGWKDLLKELGMLSMPKRNPFEKGNNYGIKK